MYNKIIDNQLDLASSWQKWQMNKYGNVVASGSGFAPHDDQKELEDRKNETVLLIETERL